MGEVLHEAGDRRVPAATLSWLEGELAAWQAEGRLDAATAAGIRGRYTASRRPALSALLLALGACFVGVGLVWLVAANLDELSPATRFAGVVAVWLGAVAAGERLAGRARPALVGAVRLVAALAFGAVVFQAAQSLQVPAYTPRLLGLWGAGALLHAYAAGALAPLLVGIAAGTGWYVWAVAERVQALAGVALALLLAAALAAALAVAHDVAGRPGFAAPWRTAAALLSLGGLFLAAVPAEDALDAAPALLAAGAAAALLACGAAAVLADRTGRLEVGVAVGVLAVGFLLVRWAPAQGLPEQAVQPALLSGEGLARAVLAVLVFLVAALWSASLGVLRDLPAVTRVATGALVVFTVFQSFALFEPVLSGAALFLVLGAVLVGTGWLADRGRRRLVADVRAVQP